MPNSTEKLIDPDTIGQLFMEGVDIIHEVNGYMAQIDDRRRQVALELAASADPFRRVKEDRNLAEEALTLRRIAGNPAKRLRVSIVHEALSGVLAHYYPET